MSRTLLGPVKNALLSALERKGIPREDVMRDRKLIPNQISLVRIALAPIPAILLLVGPLFTGMDDTVWRWIAAVVFGLLAATDGVDGHLARKHGWTSDLGRVLDPIGDKLLVVLTLLAMVLTFWDHRFNTWLYGFIALVVAREVILTLQIRAAHDVVTSPTWLGKVKMVAQAATVTLWLVPLEQYDWWAGILLFVLTAASMITVASWLEYYRLFVRDYHLKRRASGHKR